MEKVFEAMKDLEILGEKGSNIAVRDVGVAVLFAREELEGASLNIFINTRLIKNRERAEELNSKADQIIEESKKLQERIYQGVLDKIRQEENNECIDERR